MSRANLRKVGGSVMLAIPPAILDRLSLVEGAGVELSVEGEALMVRSRRPRYTLDQLLSEEAAGPAGGDDAAWLESGPAGDELL